jgi:hypothetical protein
MNKQDMTWTAGDAEHMLINPFYAVTITSELMGEHEPLVSEAQWVAANARLIDQIGAKAWLEKLLAVLQGDFPRTPDNDAVLDETHTPAE